MARTDEWAMRSAGVPVVVGPGKTVTFGPYSLDGQEPMSEQRDDEIKELRELVTSAGWHRFAAMVEEQFGPEATLRRVEEKIAGVSMGDQDGVNDMTQHVLSAAKAVRSIVQLPKERIAALSGQIVHKKPFAAWRRA